MNEIEGLRAQLAELQNLREKQLLELSRTDDQITVLTAKLEEAELSTDPQSLIIRLGDENASFDARAHALIQLSQNGYDSRIHEPTWLAAVSCFGFACAKVQTGGEVSEDVMGALSQLVAKSPVSHQSVLIYLVASLLLPRNAQQFVDQQGLPQLIKLVLARELKGHVRHDAAVVLSKLAQLVQIPGESKQAIRLWC